jgi:hypothetical protein
MRAAVAVWSLRWRPRRYFGDCEEAVNLRLIYLSAAIAVGVLPAGVMATGVLAAGVRPRAGAPPERLVVFDVVFYGRGANSIEPGDTAAADTATGVLRRDLARSARFELVDSAAVATALARAEANGIPCATLACRREIARRLGAVWMAAAKLSKTSNLIWYLSGQLMDVQTGRLLLDDELELKGRRDEMARGGAHSLARRIVGAAGEARVAAREGQ